MLLVAEFSLTAGDPEAIISPPPRFPEWFTVLLHKAREVKPRYESEPWQQFKMMCGVEIGIMISQCLVSLLRGMLPGSET